MALYYVLPGCRVFPRGSYVEDSDEGFVQRVRVAQERGRLVSMGFEGLMVPLDSVKRDLVRIQKYGLNKQNW